MENRKRFLTTLSLLAMFALGLTLRVMFLPAKTVDMKGYTDWYDYLVTHGRFLALGDEFSVYTPPYLYLLSLVTLTESFLPKLIAIKLIPIAFDFINTALVYQIVKTQFQGNKPALAAMTFWLLPTVMVNSAFWGEVDSPYTCFLLLCVFFLLKERWGAAVVAFSISFAIKAQGIFIAPLLAILYFRKRIPWHTFLYMPLVYFAMMLPALLAGRSISSLVLAYSKQADTFKVASKNAANFYFFLPESAYQATVIIGFLVTALLLLTWAWIYSTKRDVSPPRALILAALVSTALTPFLLPKMHDRYFYPADILSLVAAFFIPEIWFVPIAYQVMSMLSYQPYLFATDPWKVIPVAVAINTLTIVFLIWKQWKTTPQTN
jgi:Gpi18-like mannosyltransferase